MSYGAVWFLERSELVVTPSPAVQRFDCPTCGQPVARLLAVGRVVNTTPLPYEPGVPGWAFSRSRGWVQSDSQVRPPAEHLLEHWGTCRRPSSRDDLGPSRAAIAGQMLFESTDTKSNEVAGRKD